MGRKAHNRERCIFDVEHGCGFESGMKFRFCEVRNKTPHILSKAGERGSVWKAYIFFRFPQRLSQSLFFGFCAKTKGLREQSSIYSTREPAIPTSHAFTKVNPLRSREALPCFLAK